MITNELKTYIVSLIVRAYTVVLIILFIGFFVVVLPLEFFFLDKIIRLLGRLDLFFVPVFWITIDDQVFHFTEKKIKDIYLSAKSYSIKLNIIFFFKISKWKLMLVLN